MIGTKEEWQDHVAKRLEQDERDGHDFDMEPCEHLLSAWDLVRVTIEVEP